MRALRCDVQHSSCLLFQQPLRFPAGQAFVHHLHANAKLLSNSLREAGSLFRYFSARAVEPQRQTHHDLLHAVIPHDFPHPAHVLVAIDSLERLQRTSQSRSGVGDGEPNARAAIVYAQNARAPIFALRDFLG